MLVFTPGRYINISCSSAAQKVKQKNMLASRPNLPDKTAIVWLYFFSNFDLMPTVRSGGENVKHNVCHVYFDWPNDYRPIGNCKIISNSGKYIISYT